MIPGYETRPIGSQSDHPSTALIEACGLPEIGSELADSSVRISPDIETPFNVSGQVLTLAADVASDFWEAACALREAIELRALGGEEVRWAHRIVANATASVYGETTLRRPPASGESSRVTKRSIGQAMLAPMADLSALATEITAFLEVRDGLEACPRGEIRAAARALPLAFPTEVLLTLGGDHRQMVNWDTGANSYGLSPRPVPWRTQFGSCTASSPSPRAFAAARYLRHQLIAAGLDDVLDDAVDSINDQIRVAICESFGLSTEDVFVVLTPSGTDAEFVALAMALPEEGPLLSIILAPDEIGSGSLRAATGTHFSAHSPFNGGAEPGTPLQGLEDLNIDTALVEVRDTDGVLRDPEAVEEELRSHIGAYPGHVLLHSVEGTKTGIRLPRIETLRRWEAEFGDRLTVVVDAAQMRIDQSTVRAHVHDGRMVFVTGSKFFGGPPFSGAVLIPRTSVSHRDKPVPAGLADFLSHHDVPADLTALRAAGGEKPNFGLVLRWRAAIAEIRSFLNASPEIRDEILRRLARGIRETIDASPHLSLVESPYTAFPTDDQRGLDDLPTIFTFVVLDADGHAYDMEAAKEIHKMLVWDVSGEHGLASGLGSRQLARQPFHLGQPVAIGQPGRRVGGALRIAIGAPTLSQIVFDVSRGHNWMDRLDLEIADVQAAIEKIGVIVRESDRFRPAATKQRLGSLSG